MSKELIERLKWRIQIRNAMNADRTDPITKDMQESVTAIEALLAERDALAAELKEVREQEPVEADVVDDEEIRAQMQAVTDHWRTHGYDLDFAELVYTGERAEVEPYLRGLGGTPTVVTGSQLLVDHGLADEPDGSNFADVLYVSAEKR